MGSAIRSPWSRALSTVTAKGREKEFCVFRDGKGLQTLGHAKEGGQQGHSGEVVFSTVPVFKYETLDFYRHVSKKGRGAGLK